MTPEEHQLISGLFERMRALGPIDKDRDAESLIGQLALATPDAAYKLVQSVLVQENALEQAAARIEELEQQVQQFEQGPAPRPASGGGFLGGLFGGSKPSPAAPVARTASSVPPIGSRAGNYAAPAANPWGQQAQPAAYQPQPGYQAQPGQPMQPQRSGGGFMKTALATAAGVGGGILVAGALRDMLGGSPAHASTPGGTPGTNAGGQTGHDTAQQAQYQDSGDNDPGTYEDDHGAQDEGGGGWFGGGGGDDTEF